MKIVSESRSAATRPKPASARWRKRRSSAPLKAPSWAPSKLVEAIEAITTAAEPGTRRPVGRGREGPSPAEPAVLDADRRQLGEHPEVDREDLAALAPLLDPEQSHHRQRVGAVDEGGDAGGVGIEADGDAARRPVDDLEPDEASRPTAAGQRPGARVGEVAGALARDQAKAGAGHSADRPPGVEGRKTLPSSAEKNGKPIQAVTKRKVIAKLRSGASVPRRPA